MFEAFLVILFVLLCFAGLVADILIIYTLLRFKKLRNSFNTFLANWAIADLFSIILIQITSLTAFTSSPDHSNLRTIFIRAVLIINVTEILFGIVLCIDWCLDAYVQRLHEKLKIYYRYVIAAVWALTVLFYITFSILSSAQYYDLTISMILFVILYSINVIFVIAFQCSRIAQKFITSPMSFPQSLLLRLTFLTVIMFSYLLVVLHMLIDFLEILNHTYYRFISLLVSICAVLSSSIVTLVLLCWLNYDFRQCLFQLKIPVPQEQYDKEVSEVKDDTKTATAIASTQNNATNGHADLV